MGISLHIHGTGPNVPVPRFLLLSFLAIQTPPPFGTLFNYTFIHAKVWVVVSLHILWAYHPGVI